MTIESTINLYAFYEDKDKARELFLDALLSLQRHYGLYVASGCDCCGGVFLADGPVWRPERIQVCRPERYE